MSYAIYPATVYTAVTPSDTAFLVHPITSDRARCKGFSFSAAGGVTEADVAVRRSDGTAVTLVGLAAGVIHPISTDQILSTNTDATNIIAYFSDDFN